MYPILFFLLFLLASFFIWKSSQPAKTIIEQMAYHGFAMALSFGVYAACNTMGIDWLTGINPTTGAYIFTKNTMANDYMLFVIGYGFMALGIVELFNLLLSAPDLIDATKQKIGIND